MERQQGKSTVKALVISLSLLFAFVGCQRKCQQPGERLRNIDGTEFRVVESTDPQFRSLSLTNFVIMSFKINFAGDVFRVENNDRYNNPVLTFLWNVDAKQKLIRLQYYKPAVDPETGEPTEAQGDPEGGVKTYKYNLTNEFSMTDTSNGYYYRMVPFQGVVHPDEQCTF